MEVYTTGFTKKTAEQFFESLRRMGIRRLLDVRLNNVSQLAGFSKREDLAYFLRELCGAEYIHEPLLAPTQELLDEYKKQKGSWEEYTRRFLALMHERHIEDRISPTLFDVPTVLLCSEATAEHCHRRLVLEYLQSKWGNLTITHL
ncbi:MAG: DUF488 domain-containing protein [Ktedonobacterales bacterium]